MDTAKQLKNEIIAIRKLLGWSNSKLAEVIAVDESDDEVDMIKFAEKLKKQFQRNTTPVELLEGYLRIVKNHSDYKKKNRVVANPIRLDVVDSRVLFALQAMAAEVLLTEECE